MIHNGRVTVRLVITLEEISAARRRWYHYAARGYVDPDPPRTDPPRTMRPRNT